MARYEVPAAVAPELVAGNAKKAQSAAEATSAAMLSVPPSQLREIPGFNVRVETSDYLSHVADVKTSIKENGWYPNKPLAGYVGKEDGADVIFITDGHTRLKALTQLADEGHVVERVTVVLKPAGQAMEDLTVALIQDNEGRPLSVYEKAIVIKRLQGLGLENPVIASRLGVTDRYVNDLLVLAGAPASVRNLVISGKVSATEAIKQVRKNPEKAGETLKAAADNAAAAGKTKATGKDVKAAKGEAPEKKTGTSASNRVVGGKNRTVLTYRWKQGDILPVDDIKPVRLLNGAEWWNFVDENTKEHVVIEENIEIEVVIITDAKTEEQASATSGAGTTSTDEDDEFAVPAGTNGSTDEDDEPADDAALAAAETHLDEVTDAAGEQQPADADEL